MVAEPEAYDEPSDKADILTDVKALSFSVRDPQDAHGHIVYVVKGKDE